MVEVLEKCAWCGMPARPNAIFCHHCGRSLTADRASLTKTAPTGDLRIEAAAIEAPKSIESPPSSANGSSAAALDANSDAAPTNDKTSTETLIVKSKTVETKSSATAMAEPAVMSAVEKPEIPVSAAAKPRVRKTKRYVNQTEYVWEAADAPVWRILLFAVLALAAVAFLVWFSSTLR